MNRMFHLIRPSAMLLAASFALLGLGTSLAGCGDSSNPSATISNVSVEPETPYPGVETTITYEITDTSVSSDELSWEVNFGDGTTQTGDGAEAEAIHAYQQSSSYTVQLRALASGSVVATQNVDLTVRPRVDLSVENATPRPSNVEPGDALTIEFDLRNRSAANMTTPFDVPVFYTREDSVSLDALSNGTLQTLGTGTLSANEQGVVIEGGRTRSASIQLTVPDDVAGGQWRIVPWLKPDGQFADTNPANNFLVGSSPLFVDAPGNQQADVAVNDVYAIPDFAYPALNQFTHGFDLENVGGAEAPDVRARTYLSVGDTELDDSDMQVATTQESYDVPAGSSVTVGPTEVVLDSDITAEMGDKQVYVLVEAFIDTDVTDVSPDNNVGVGEPPITVSNQRVDGPDIAVNSFSVSPTSTFLDGTLELEGQITNEGAENVEGSFVCPVFLGEEPRVRRTQDETFSQINVPSLDSQESTSFSRTVTIPALYDPGTYYIYIVCDASGSIGETFRANNQKIFPDPVEITDQADIDLFVDELSVPQTTTEGQTTTLTATVCVTGSNPSGNTRASLYRNAGSSVDFSEDPIRTFSVDSIPPDECRDVEIDVPASCQNFQETYSYGMAVDVDESLPENNEENNQTAGSNPITVDGEYCDCTADMYEPNNSRGNWANVSSGTTSASLCDPGGCDYFEVTDVAAGDSLVVETDFDADVGPLTTSLFDASGLTQLDTDSTPGRQQVGVFNVPSKSDYTFTVSGDQKTYVLSRSADYTFTVCGATSQARNLYSLNVDKIPQPSGIDLLPRRPDLQAQSQFIIGESVQFETRIHNIGTQASGSFDAELIITPDRTVGDGNDVLMEPATVSVNSISSGSAQDVTIDSSIPTSLNAGEYYIAINLDPQGSLTEANTSNNVAISNAIEVRTRCYDPLEPNDTFQSATEIQSGSYSNLAACASEPDIYQVCATDGKTFTAEANFNAAKGDIDLQLLDSQLNVVDSSAQSGVSTESVTESYVNGDQCYYVRTELFTTQSELEMTYSLDLNIQSVPSSLQCESTFEPNNYTATASSLLSALSSSSASNPLVIDRCPQSDDDFYKVNLTQGQQVTFRGLLDPASQSGTLTLQLYNPSESVIKSKQTSPGDSTVEIADYIAPQAGTYYLQTSISGSSRKLTYRLEGSGFGGIDLEADNLDFWSGNYNPGGDVFFDVDIANLRAGTANAPTLEIYYSTQSTFSTSSATLMDSYTLSDVSGNTTTTVSKQATLPGSIQSGTQYIHARIVPASSQTDASPNNNIDTRTISITTP
jgi:hypothetical protein